MESFSPTSVGAEEKLVQPLTWWGMKEPIENWAVKSVFGQRRCLKMCEGCPSLCVREEALLFTLSSAELGFGETQKKKSQYPKQELEKALRVGF